MSDKRWIPETFRVSAGLVFLLAPDLFGAQEPARMGAPAASRTQVVMLGTGTPGPSPERSGSAIAIVVNGTAYLVDIGPEHRPPSGDNEHSHREHRLLDQKAAGRDEHLVEQR